MILLDTTTLTGAQTFVSAGMQLEYTTTFAESELNVTAAATGVTDTLDVYLQTSVDHGTTWDDLTHFTQVLGNGGAKKFLARWTGVIAPTIATPAAPQDAALAVTTTVQGPKALFWRVKAVVVQVTAAVFTLRVTTSARRELGN